MSDLKTSDLPVYLAVHTDEQDKRNHSVDDQIKIDEVYLDIERVCPQSRGMKVAGVVGGIACHHDYFQLKEPGRIVEQRKYRYRENIEERGPGSRELNKTFPCTQHTER